MAGFGGGDGELDGLQVAHFPYHDHVGIFAKGSAEGGGKGVGVGVDLALGDVAALGFEHVLDRVFQGNDVIVPGPVDLLDQGRQRGGLAAAHRAGNQHQAVVILCEQLQSRRQPELVHGADLGGDDPKYHVNPEPVADDAGPETAASIGVGEIHVAPLHELVSLVFVEKAESEALGFGGGELWGLQPDRLKLAKPPPDRLGVYPQVDIRGVGFLADTQILVDMTKSVNLASLGEFINGGGL